MLIELSIRDLALLEEVELAFGPGLNAITGETGAGKSLLVGALELLLGERPRGDPAGWVREGAERARVEGRFAVPEGPVAERVTAWFEENLPAFREEWEEGRAEGEPELIVGRTLSRDGRTRSHVNHRPVALRSLRGLVPLLIEIHGQNDHQRLLQPAEQHRLVDSFGGLETRVREYAAKRAAWRGLLDRVARLDEERAERRDRLEYLRFQAGELDAAGLSVEEQPGLLEERAVLRSAGELGAQLGGLVEELAEGEAALLDRLREADRLVTRWRPDIPALDEPSEELRGAVMHLEEAAAGLRSFVSGIEMDPVRLEEVEGRLAELERLEHRYRMGVEQLLERREAIDTEIATLEAAEEDASTLGHELSRARGAMADRAGALARARRALRGRLSRAVQEVLADLGLARAELALEIRPRGAPSPNAAGASGAEADPETDRSRFGPRGTDDLELQLAANPGEAPRPLAQVVSGGEAARVMLALRTILAAGDGGRTLVFDEIDAGVGGRLGPRVGAHLRALAEHHQVLCVTHLPAIAAMAHVHLRVTKATRRGRTRTTVAQLEGDERVQEVADMIAGGADQATARAEARRLLESV